MPFVANSSWGYTCMSKQFPWISYKFITTAHRLCIKVVTPTFPLWGNAYMKEKRQSVLSWFWFSALEISDFLNSKDDGETSPTIDTKDPLNKALCKFCIKGSLNFQIFYIPQDLLNTVAMIKGVSILTYQPCCILAKCKDSI